MTTGSHTLGLKTALLVLLCAIGTFLSAAIHPALATSSDYDGDKTADVVTSYDYGNATTRLWGFRSDGSSFIPALLWFSGQGQFDATRTKLVSGDFDGDSKSDVAILYDYGNSTSRIWIFKSDGSNMAPSLAWYSGPGKFDASRAKLVSGDFDGDGKADIAALYDYGNSTSRFWFFKSDGATFAPSTAWDSGTGKFTSGHAVIKSGDFDGDGKTDVAALYDYGSGTSRLWVFKADGTTLAPAIAWYSGLGKFAAGRAMMTCGDYDGDGKFDIAVLYDYGNATSRIWLFRSDGISLTPAIAWYSGSGKFASVNVKLTSGDYDNDGKSDISMLYDYKGATSRFWVFKSDGANFSPDIFWYSEQAGFDWNRTRLADAESGSAAIDINNYVIGYSVLGRPLIATRIGSGARRYLFVGVHHGDEPQGGWTLDQFRTYLSVHPDAVPVDTEVWIIPFLNPDGLAAGTRWNARGVNLNRNYGTNDWGLYDVTSITAAEAAGLVPLRDMSAVITGIPYSFNYPGPVPFSEPETVAVAGLCAGKSFRAMVTVHDAEGCVYWGQTGVDLAYLFGGKAGLPVAGPLSISGDATRWFGQAYGSPSITVEMTPDQANGSPATVFNAYLPALLATINY